MTRGNQRDVRRQKQQKELAKSSKHVNNLSGTEFQRAKESDADKMRAKQKKADERKTAEGLEALKNKKQ